MGRKSTSIRVSCKAAVFALAGSGLLCAAPAFAGRKSTTTTVQLEVKSTCKVQANDLDFGWPARNARTVVASTTMQITCTPGTLYRVGIDNGQHFNGSTRRMYAGQSNGRVWYADYQLYRDPLGLLPWTDTFLGSVFGILPASGVRTLNVYGVAQVRNLRPAEYRDTVTVYLEF